MAKRRFRRFMVERLVNKLLKELYYKNESQYSSYDLADSLITQCSGHLEGEDFIKNLAEEYLDKVKKSLIYSERTLDMKVSFINIDLTPIVLNITIQYETDNSCLSEKDIKEIAEKCSRLIQTKDEFLYRLSQVLKLLLNTEIVIKTEGIIVSEN